MYDLSQPDILQLYGLSEVCTCECFFLSELLANLRSHPSYSHLNGFSPVKTQIMLLLLLLLLSSSSSLLLQRSVFVHHVAHKQNHKIIQAFPVLLRRRLGNCQMHTICPNNNLQQKFDDVHFIVFVSIVVVYCVMEFFGTKTPSKLLIQYLYYIEYVEKKKVF